MARAVRDFVGCKEEGNGLLPVTGNIPDMFSDSERLEINNFSKGPPVILLRWQAKLH